MAFPISFSSYVAFCKKSKCQVANKSLNQINMWFDLPVLLQQHQSSWVNLHTVFQGSGNCTEQLSQHPTILFFSFFFISPVVCSSCFNALALLMILHRSFNSYPCLVVCTLTRTCTVSRNQDCLLWMMCHV